jgi:hypothetical protein
MKKILMIFALLLPLVGVSQKTSNNYTFLLNTSDIEKVRSCFKGYVVSSDSLEEVYSPILKELANNLKSVKGKSEEKGKFVFKVTLDKEMVEVLCSSLQFSELESIEQKKQDIIKIRENADYGLKILQTIKDKDNLDFDVHPLLKYFDVKLLLK